MKTHSRMWFLEQVAETKRDIEQWPNWMKEGKRVATASFPHVGESDASTLGKKSTSNQVLSKRKAHG